MYVGEYGVRYNTLYVAHRDPEFVVDALKEDVACAQLYLSERGLFLESFKDGVSLPP